MLAHVILLQCDFQSSSSLIWIVLQLLFVRSENTYSSTGENVAHILQKRLLGGLKQYSYRSKVLYDLLPHYILGLQFHYICVDLHAECLTKCFNVLCCASNTENKQNHLTVWFLFWQFTFSVLPLYGYTRFSLGSSKMCFVSYVYGWCGTWNLHFYVEYIFCFMWIKQVLLC